MTEIHETLEKEVQVKRNPPKRLTIADGVRFAVGIFWAYLWGVHYSFGYGGSWISPGGLGTSTGILIVALLISYLWKGRKRNWHGMSWVFLIVCFVWPAVRENNALHNR